MKLRALTVEQFGKFDRPTRLAGLSDGLNIVCGPNEMGKSTLLKAIRAALFERYSSKSATARTWQNNAAGGAPMVRLEFELSGKAHRISKRFVDRPRALLVSEENRQLRGDEAESELQRLLGLEQGRGGQRTTPGIWGLLWLSQGDSLGPPAIHDSVGRTLAECIERELSNVTDSREADDLLARFSGELANLVGKSGKPVGHFNRLQNRLDDAKQALQRLECTKQAIDADTAQLTNCESELAKSQNADAIAAEERAVRVAEDRLTEFQQLQLRTQHAATAMALAEGEHKAVQGERDQRGQRAQKRAELERDYARERKSETEIRHRQRQEQRSEELALAELQQLEQQLAGARRVLDRNQTLAGLIIRQDHQQERERRFADARQAARQWQSLSQQLADNPVETADVDSLRTAVNERLLDQATVDAGATVIVHSLNPDNASKVRFNGKSPRDPSGTTRTVDSLAIDIEGIGRITIQPALPNKARLSERIGRAKHRESGLLQRMRVTSLREAEQRLAEKQSLLRDAASARERCELYGGQLAGQLLQSTEQITDPTTADRQALARELAAVGLERPPPAAEVERSLAASKSQFDELSNRLAGAKQVAEKAALARQHTRSQLAKLEGRLEQLKQHKDALSLQHGDADSGEPDSTLATRIADKRASLEHAQQTLKTLETRLAGHSIADAAASLDVLKAKQTARQRRVQALREEIGRLRGAIQARAGDGIDEQIGAAEHELAAFASERGLLQREASVLGLLVETLTSAKQSVTARYREPILQRLAPYLTALFPQAELVFDDSFALQSLVRNGIDEQFDTLSHGTQEQIAIVVRLAFADLLLDHGLPATLVLDDALVFSDDRRITVMFDLLQQAAKHMQIMIFTCRESLFKQLDATFLEPLTIDDNEFPEFSR